MEGAREVDRLSAEVENLCYDWRRMRSVLERLAKMRWWDLHSLCCLYCHAPFDVATGECDHEVDCVYQRCCEIVGAAPLPIPHEVSLGEWEQASQASEARLA